MIPKVEDHFDKLLDSRDRSLTNIAEAMKEYGRRLLDHVAEKAKEDGNLLTIWQILKIKDGL